MFLQHVYVENQSKSIIVHLTFNSEDIGYWLWRCDFRGAFASLFDSQCKNCWGYKYMAAEKVIFFLACCLKPF